MSVTSPLAIVLAWQGAANLQDSERLIELSAPDIEIVGPRGSGYGHQLLRDWLGRAGLRLSTERAFVHDTVVVLAQHGIWQSLETGKVTGERDLASRFRVEDQRIVQFARHDSLESALAGAGLHNTDEVPLAKG